MTMERIMERHPKAVCTNILCKVSFCFCLWVSAVVRIGFFFSGRHVEESENASQKKTLEKEMLVAYFQAYWPSQPASLDRAYLTLSIFLHGSAHVDAKLAVWCRQNVLFLFSLFEWLVSFHLSVTWIRNGMPYTYFLLVIQFQFQVCLVSWSWLEALGDPCCIASF